MSGEPEVKRTKMSELEQLKQYCTVVADTGDFEGWFQLFFSNYHLQFLFNYLGYFCGLSNFIGIFTSINLSFTLHIIAAKSI